MTVHGIGVVFFTARRYVSPVVRPSVRPSVRHVGGLYPDG